MMGIETTNIARHENVEDHLVRKSNNDEKSHYAPRSISKVLAAKGELDCRSNCECDTREQVVHCANVL